MWKLTSIDFLPTFFQHFPHWTLKIVMKFDCGWEWKGLFLICVVNSYKILSFSQPLSLWISMTLILSVVQQTCGALGYFYTLCKYILVITKVWAIKKKIIKQSDLLTERMQAHVAFGWFSELQRTFEINRYFALTSFYYVVVWLEKATMP